MNILNEISSARGFCIFGKGGAGKQHCRVFYAQLEETISCFRMKIRLLPLQIEIFVLISGSDLIITRGTFSVLVCPFHVVQLQVFMAITNYPLKCVGYLLFSIFNQN